MTIGIPKSLLYHRYNTLWESFFEYLDIDTITSPSTNKEILEEGIKYANDEACLSLKIYLGHIKYLANKCDYILIPRIESLKKYEKLTGKVPFIGTLAEESALRTQSYLKTGCNSFNSKRPNSTPLGFWTEQDILHYIYKFKLPINEAYGEVIIEDDKYKTTKCDRTGCIACGFGVHLEKNPNRFERMKEEYPKQYNYYFNKLGYKEICDYIGIKY